MFFQRVRQSNYFICYISQLDAVVATVVEVVEEVVEEVVGSHFEKKKSISTREHYETNL